MAFIFRRKGDKALVDSSRTNAELDIALTKLGRLLLSYDTPLDDQWDALDG